MVSIRLLGWIGAAAAALGVTVAATRGPEALVSWIPFAERFYTRWIPPEAPQLGGVSEQERSAFGRLAAEVSGRVVWSSNREGNHELYLVDLGTGAERRLTTDPHVDFFSRFSPDGRQISFLRSRREWVSFRDLDGWDAWVMNADGGNARRVARRAYHPVWTPDGSGLIYVQANAVVRLDLASGEETVLQRGPDPPTGGNVEEAELSAGGLLGVTLRNVPGEGVGIVDLDAGTYRGLSSVRACQITWTPNGGQAVWIDPGGHGGTRVMHADVNGGEERILIDLPGEYSHEYFPRVTGDGRWLIWGASAGGHEHDRADYEVFVWQIGSPSDAALRLTYSASNDQWPDFYIDP